MIIQLACRAFCRLWIRELTISTTLRVPRSHMWRRRTVGLRFWPATNEHIFIQHNVIAGDRQLTFVDMLLLLFCRNTVFHEKLLEGFSSDAWARAWANYYRVQDELLSWLQMLLSYRWIHAVSMEGCRSLRCRMRCPTASYPPRKLSQLRIHTATAEIAVSERSIS